MKSLSNLITLLVVAALTLLAGPTSAATWYVDGTASGNGTSWAQGFETIAEAIADANAPDEIWVKAGTYTISSQMLVDEAIGIYGGFAGSETERSQRDWATNTTTIDGQDSTRILKINNETIIDGFILTNGYYDASSTFSGGGAINIGPGTWDKTPKISNCIISNNTVYSNPIGIEGIKGGGAIYVGTGNPLFVNCLITNNSTNAYGGGINIYNGSPDFVNCTISKNSAVVGGGLYMQGKDTVINAQFYNCIISGNTDTTDANDIGVHPQGDDPTGSNNCSSVEIGTGTFLADPLFIDPNDFHLQAGSPCIDAGDSNSVPADITNDLDGGPRFINGTYADESPLPHVDIGAYEFGKLHCGNGDLPYPTGDINLDCGVDLIDSAMFIWCWLTNAGETGWDPNCNLYDADLTIDIYDLDVFGENWLTFAFLPPLELVTVPDVVDTAQASAEAAITEADLVVGSVTTSYDPAIATGNVISQNPVADSSVLPGTSVDLVVSLGPEPVTVPDVVGMLQATAEAAITAAGLVVGDVTTSYDPVIAAGNVISQDPVADSSVLPGTSVDLVVSLGPEPVGHWKMDDNTDDATVLDSSVNGNHGTAQQNTEYMSTIGIIDGALDFDGTSDYVDLGTSTVIRPSSQLSLACWLYVDELSVAGVINNKIDGQNSGYRLLTADTGVVYYQVGCTGGLITLGSSSVITTGTWHLIVATYDENNGASIYIDGVPAGSAAAAGQILYGTGSSYLGCLLDGNGDPKTLYKGSLDDVKIFSKALSASEVIALYDESGI